MFGSDPQGDARARERGVALLTALALLLLFSMLGTGYLRYMRLEMEDTGREMNVVRAENLAESAVYTAIANLTADTGSDRALSEQYSLALPVYYSQQGGRAEIAQTVDITIEDEAARVNLNLAPAPLLQLLGFTGAQTSALQSSLREMGPLSDLDQLWTRGILSRSEFEALDTRLFTVFTTGGNEAGYININTAGPKVLAAVFGISDEEARQLSAKRPFSSWQDAVIKSGREPSTFTLQPDQLVSRAIPRALALQSRWFRIRAEVTLDPRAVPGPRAGAAVTAVVEVGPRGTYEILFWNRGRPGNGPQTNIPESAAAPPDDRAARLIYQAHEAEG